MIINTKYNPGQVVSYGSKLGGFKTGTIEKVFTNAYSDKKVYIGYFIKGVLRDFKETELKPIEK